MKKENQRNIYAKKIEGKLVTYNIDYLLENLQEEVKKWENYKAANERFKATMDRMIERLDDAKRREKEEMTAGIISKETAVNAAYDLRKFCNQQKSCAKCIFQTGDEDNLDCTFYLEPNHWDDLPERKEEMLREVYKDVIEKM